MRALAGCAVLVGILTAAPAAAQTECKSLLTCEPGHALPDYFFGGNKGNPHLSCLICVGGDPTNCHPYCVFTSADPKVQQGFERVVAAASRGAAAEVVVLGRAFKEHVYFNAERGAVQILSCDRMSVLASLPLTTPEARKVAASLPHITDQKFRRVVLVSRNQVPTGPTN
jgi:hypothetical protein